MAPKEWLVECPKCHGTGVDPDTTDKCVRCKGEGWIDVHKELASLEDEDDGPVLPS